MTPPSPSWLSVNNVSLDWRQIDWRQVEENVRRLRQRIFTAAKAGDLPRVRRLQK
jgi:RNA-directed DNA polymerase